MKICTNENYPLYGSTFQVCDTGDLSTTRLKLGQVHQICCPCEIIYWSRLLSQCNKTIPNLCIAQLQYIAWNCCLFLSDKAAFKWVYKICCRGNIKTSTNRGGGGIGWAVVRVGCVVLGWGKSRQIVFILCGLHVSVWANIRNHAGSKHIPERSLQRHQDSAQSWCLHE